MEENTQIELLTKEEKPLLEKYNTLEVNSFGNTMNDKNDESNPIPEISKLSEIGMMPEVVPSKLGEENDEPWSEEWSKCTSTTSPFTAMVSHDEPTSEVKI